jgi:hypothetical protein
MENEYSGRTLWLLFPEDYHAMCTLYHVESAFNEADLGDMRSSIGMFQAFGTAEMTD